jgi:phenylalanyl-tRNA synthetase alpha chain
MHELINKLHPLERAIIPYLDQSTVQAISKSSNLKQVETNRALQWLENKGVVKINITVTKHVHLGKNGLIYKKTGLPEKIFLQHLTEEFKGLNVITKKSKLSREEVNASIGILRKLEAIDIQKEEGLQVRITDVGKAIISQESPAELFLEQKFPVAVTEVDKTILKQLQKRKDFVTLEEEKAINIGLTELGQKLMQADLGEEAINRLTSKMLKDRSWQEKNFRAYDVEINVPRKYAGKKHFVNQACDYAKQVWIEMGFKEMTGNMVQTSFWNFDALFTAQDHPVRELQDTFYLGGKAEKGKLPEDKIVRDVKEVHETGGSTGSKGWQYTWDANEAKKNILRTHTTVLTARTLHSLRPEDLPAKFFALGKNFRNEALDWKHLFEFNQTEGIVVDENGNFRNLLGYLKQFFRKMGFPDARFRPAFFPYTEPSVEIDVIHPVKKEWVEFGGAGILRPEVVIPLLGKDIPVLAWGPGFDRTILEYYDINDIRDLYRNDMKQLREIKAWLR